MHSTVPVVFVAVVVMLLAACTVNQAHMAVNHVGRKNSVEQSLVAESPLLDHCQSAAACGKKGRENEYTHICICTIPTHHMYLAYTTYAYDEQMEEERMVRVCVCLEGGGLWRRGGVMLRSRLGRKEWEGVYCGAACIVEVT